jgi:hypothetical protein
MKFFTSGSCFSPMVSKKSIRFCTLSSGKYFLSFGLSVTVLSSLVVDSI